LSRIPSNLLNISKFIQNFAKGEVLKFSALRYLGRLVNLLESEPDILHLLATEAVARWRFPPRAHLICDFIDYLICTPLFEIATSSPLICM